MDASLVIPALFFAAIAIVMIGYIIRVFASALGGGNPLAYLEKVRFNRKYRLIAETNEAEADAVDKCISAFHLQELRYSASLLDAVAVHNMTVLSRLVTVAEKRGGHLPNLQTVETLLATRAELMRVRWEVSGSMRKLNRRKETGRKSPAPDWAVNEFQKKATEIKSKLSENRRALDTQIAELSTALKSMSRSSQITYH